MARSALIFPLTAFAFALIPVSAYSQLGDADALQGMAQAEKHAGRVSGFRVVEAYRAIAVTTAASIGQGGKESDAETARKWAEAFCAAASEDFHWDSRWQLVVYAEGTAQPAHACLIPRPAKPGQSRSRGKGEDEIACEPNGGPALAPVDEVNSRRAERNR